MYRQKPSPQYENPRKSWMTGYRNALKTRQELQAQGWFVERGALTPKQVERLTVQLEREGYETQTIPVLEWQYVAYKPKPESEQKPPEPEPTPPAKPEPPSRNPVEVFQEIFWKGRSQPEQPDDGVLLDPGRMLFLVPKGASPQNPSYQKLTQLMEETVQQAEKVEPLDYDKFVKTEKVMTQSQKFLYVSFDSTDTCYSIDLIKKAMRVLGTEKKAEAYYKPDTPLIVRHKETGHSIGIAPAYLPATDPKVVPMTTVQAM